MKNSLYNRNPYKHLWGYGPTKPFTRSVILNRDHYRPLPKPPKEKPKPKNKGLLERIKKLEFWFT